MEVKKVWTRSDIDELIREYRSKPELWDVNDVNFKEKAIKKEALITLSLIFNTSVEEVVRKIHNLRNQFNNELRKIRLNKSEHKIKKYYTKWPFFKPLWFLKECFPNKSTTGEPNEDEDEKHYLKFVQDEEPPNAEDSNGAFEKNDRKSEDRKPIVPKRKPSSPLENYQSNYNSNKPIEKPIRIERDDQYEVFGKYVASEIRCISRHFLRRKLKRKIQQAILDVAEEDEDLPNTSVDPIRTVYTKPTYHYSDSD